VNPINGTHRKENGHICVSLEEASIAPLKASLAGKLSVFEPKVEQFRELRKPALSHQESCLESVKAVFGEVRSILQKRENEMVDRINSFFSISPASPEELLAAADSILALAKKTLNTHTDHDSRKKDNVIQVVGILRF
jgi:hypothetical protein